MRFRDLKLGTKQLIGFGVILIFMGAANLVSLRRMEMFKTQLQDVSTNWLPRAIAVADINNATTELRLNQLQHVIARDSSGRQRTAEVMINLIDEINAHLDTYEKLREDAELRGIYSEDEGKLFQHYLSRWEAYQDLCFDFFSLSMQNRDSAAIALLEGEASLIFDEVTQLLVQLVSISEDNSRDATARAEVVFREARGLMTTLIILAIAVSTIFIVVLIRWTTIPIKQLERAAGEVASGDLAVHIDVPGKDEVGSLAESFNQMTNALQESQDRTEQQASALRRQASQLKASNSEIQTKNKDLEIAMRELRDTQERLLMKEKMAALGDLVAGVAHEINNPIGSVLAATDVSGRCIKKIEIVVDEADSIETVRRNPDFPKAMGILKENVQVTFTAGKRIATIVKSLKNFARVDESEYKRVDIHEGLESSLTLLSSEMGRRITVKRDFAPLPPVFCYPGQLNQVFFNVLRNAIDAIENEGVITLKTRDADKSIKIEFFDTGRGISKERLSRVFDFGFADDGTRVKMSSGLKTAYNIVQRHNGEIVVDSEPGKGTAVSIVIPKR